MQRFVKVDNNQTQTAYPALPKLSLVADLIGSAPSTEPDQVLLWAGGGASSVAFWDLKDIPSAVQAEIDTVKSVDTLPLDGSVLSVTDVLEPGFENLKVLTTSGHSLYVLHLDSHNASPILAPTNITITLGLVADRAWGYAPSQPDFGQIGLSDAHSENVQFDQPIDRLLEVERSGSPNAVLTFHGLTGSTWWPASPASEDFGGHGLRADKPDVPTSRRYTSVMLESSLNENIAPGTSLAVGAFAQVALSPPPPRPSRRSATARPSQAGPVFAHVHHQPWLRSVSTDNSLLSSLGASRTLWDEGQLPRPVVGLRRKQRRRAGRTPTSKRIGSPSRSGRYHFFLGCTASCASLPALCTSESSSTMRRLSLRTLRGNGRSH